MTEPITLAGTVLNVGLDPRVLADSGASAAAAIAGVGPTGVRAGLRAAAERLAEMGLGFENCLLDPAADPVGTFRAVLRRRSYTVIVFGGGVRLDPAMTPLFEELVNLARVEASGSVFCFNTGPDTTVDAVRRCWPSTPPSAAS